MPISYETSRNLGDRSKPPERVGIRQSKQVETAGTTWDPAAKPTAIRQTADDSPTTRQAAGVEQSGFRKAPNNGTAPWDRMADGQRPPGDAEQQRRRKDADKTRAKT